MLQHH